MALLILAALLWLGVHIGLSGTALRDVAVARVGAGAFAGVFSLLATLAMVLLIAAYATAGTEPLWVAPSWLIGLIDAAMLMAFILFAGAVIPPRGGAADGPRGMARVTRHPMMCAFALWAGCHLLANGDSAGVVFFGAFLLTVLFGVPSIDAKFARREQAKAAALHAATSRLPFAAILAGRNRLVPAEIGWLPLVAGVAGWLALLWLHPHLFGVPALPY